MPLWQQAETRRKVSARREERSMMPARRFSQRLECRRIIWSVDTLDWKTRNAQHTIDTVLRQVQDGDIILMHDLYEQSVIAAETMIPELTRRGYQLVTVSEMAELRGGMAAGQSYGHFRYE